MSKEDQEALQAKIDAGLQAEKEQKRKEFKQKMKKEKSSFIKDFKKFITRGNVVDMAVGVVIGGAFGKIVTGLVNYIINPFIGLFMKEGCLDDLKTVLKPGVEEVLDAEGNVVTEAVKEVALLWGMWIQTIIDFLITALCIFVVIRVIEKTKARLEAKQIAEAAEKAAAEKAEADAKAAAEAEAAAEKAAAEKAALDQLYANIQKQTELLEKIANK